MSTQTFNKSTLAELYMTIPGCIKRGKFTLASGLESDYYIDSKKLTLKRDGLLTAAVCVNRLLREENLRADAIGGMELGAVFLTAACVLWSDVPDKALDGFVIRKRAKDHGVRSRIEGNVEPGDRVVVVEDTTTTGGTLLEAAAVLREFGCEVIAGVTVVDRQQGAGELLAEHGLPFYALLTTKDLGL